MYRSCLVQSELKLYINEVLSSSRWIFSTMVGYGGSSARWLATVDLQHDGWLRVDFQHGGGWLWWIVSTMVDYSGSPARWLVTVDLQHDGWLRSLFNTKVDYGGCSTQQLVTVDLQHPRALTLLGHSVRLMLVHLLM